MDRGWRPGHAGSLVAPSTATYIRPAAGLRSLPLARASTRQQRPDRKLAIEEILAALVSDGLVTRQQSEQLRFSLQQRDTPYEHPLVAVADQNWLSATEPRGPLDLERLTRWLAERIGLPYLRIDPLKIDVGAVTGVMKHAYASRFGILPVAVSGDRVTVATAEPFVREWERELSQMLKLRFERVVANPLAIKRYLGEFYAISRSISGAATSRAAAPVSTSSNLEQLIELDKIGEPDANDQHVVRIVDWLLQYAFDQRASDIHLEPRRDEANVRFRIDGRLHLVSQVPTPVMAAVVSRLKAIGRMDVVERRRPQDGRVKTKSPNGREVELRLSTMPTTFGEKLVMRIFDPDVLIKSFPDLGFSADDETLWTSIVEQPHGMVVVTGPTGSGKTTTLYSALKRLASPDLNVCTIEDPIELVDPQLNQMYVQHSIGLDFATGVRTLLRQDPDIIMVGEIRDAETADTAIQAALTGHLVLTTLHTNDAPSSIARFLDLGVAPYLVKSALLGVVAQRLVRTLCPHCKGSGTISEDEWQALVTPWEMPRPRQVATPVGCDECRHTGYRGRIGIYEILRLSDSLRRLITTDLEIPRLRAGALDEGMRPLRLSGAEKVARGLTTAAEVFSVVQEDSR
ncbi:MAG: type II/IV secretion system protein [Chromatiales bacterium]|nr:type II/IV secretion system protein [Chromatiales bacterium]